VVNIPEIDIMDDCPAMGLTVVVEWMQKPASDGRGVRSNPSDSLLGGPMTINTLEDLFVHDLQQVYYVEKRLVDVLGDLVDDASNDNLTQGFSDHRDETRRHVENIERVFEAIGHEPEEQPSRVLDALVEEHEEFVEQSDDEHLHDLYDMQAGMKTERVEITAYQGLIMLASKLDYPRDVNDLLEDNLSDEKSALRELEALSKGSKFKSMLGQLTG
jgi:ferritin-like metal-binding protein YciE